MESNRATDWEVERAFRRDFRRLRGLAYQITGQWQAAEEIAAEAFSRLALNAPTDVSAWLTTVTANLAIDFSRSEQVRREKYIGPWLPEIAHGETEYPDISRALVRLLQTLSPLQRGIYVLSKVEGLSAREIAAIVESTPAAVRQQISRCQRQLANHVSTEDADSETIEKLKALMSKGEIELFIEELSDHAILWTDSGGYSKAARNPIRGKDRIERFLMGLFSKYGVPKFFVGTHATGAMLIARSSDLVRWITVEMTDGAISGIQILQNPSKMLDSLHVEPTDQAAD